MICRASTTIFIRYLEVKQRLELGGLKSRMMKMVQWECGHCCSSGRVRIFLLSALSKAASSVNFRVGPSIMVSCSYTMSSNLRRNSLAEVNPVLVFYFQRLVSKALRSVHGLCMLFPLNFSATDNFR
jgi:hypothetical protein